MKYLSMIYYYVQHKNFNHDRMLALRNEAKNSDIYIIGTIHLPGTSGRDVRFLLVLLLLVTIISRIIII